MVVSGFSDKVMIGPFSASFTIDAAEQLAIDVLEPVKHDDFTEYELRLQTGAKKRDLVNVVIYDYGNSTEVSENRLMDLIAIRVASQTYKATWNRSTVGNISAMRAKIRSSGKSYYIAAYSPDAKNNTGKTMVLVESFASLNVTDSFLRNLQVSRA